MKFELIIKGNPGEFAAMADFLGIRLRIEKGENSPSFNVQGDPNKFTPHTNTTRVEFCGPSNEKTGWGWITAQKIPNEKTLLYVTAEDENWEKLKVYWRLLYEELQRLGWTEQDLSSKKPRRDTANRVALTIYYLEKNICPTRKSATKRARTSSESLNKFEDHPDVKKILERLRKDPNEVGKLKNQLARLPDRKGKS